jgi:phytoene dehydrogenase-like protein
MSGGRGNQRDAVFDAIIIGGGHNGQILATYLRKAGLETLVLERRLEPGGGLCTEEVTLPGYYHNLHSFFMRWVPDLPWYKDLELERYGVRMIMPPVQTVSPFVDGRCLVFHSDIEKTIKSIACFSKRDAVTYRGLIGRFEEMNNRIITPENYAAPISFEEKKSLLEKSSLGRDYLEMCLKTPMELARELFESEEMRAYLIFMVTTRMLLPDEPGLGYGVAAALAGGSKGSMCSGGSHYLAHGLAASLEANGARIWEASHVREITIERGRATGVVLNDGRCYRARKLVASSVDIPQTYLDLVGRENLAHDIVDKARAFKFSKWGLFGVHLALKDSLQYKSQAFDPDVNLGLNYNIGLENLDQFNAHMSEIGKGLPPNLPGMQCAQPTLHDRTQAPHSRHTAFLWQFAPYDLYDGGPEAWDRVKHDYAEVCLERWREYAPNLNKDNILGKYIFTPLDVERKLINMRRGDHCIGRASRDQMLENRPFPGCKPYRTSVEGLYLCGSGSHPMGNITGAPGYNAAKVICEDLGITPWWQPADIKQQWEQMARD